VLRKCEGDRVRRVAEDDEVEDEDGGGGGSHGLWERDGSIEDQSLFGRSKEGLQHTVLGICGNVRQMSSFHSPRDDHPAQYSLAL
jgi:hypothetical protein